MLRRPTLSAKPAPAPPRRPGPPQGLQPQRARGLLLRGPSAPSAPRRPALGLLMQAGGLRQRSHSGPRQHVLLLPGPLQGLWPGPRRVVATPRA
ncbi:hypothetical protein EAG14_19335 [Acidovorax sp. 1608163]|nr:hypothetical protein EAG14_19335 [Acidovorax sp. 1608163]